MKQIPSGSEEEGHVRILRSRDVAAKQQAAVPSQVRELYYVAGNITSGMGHRLATMNHVAKYAATLRVLCHFLWPVSRGVGYLAFEKLFRLSCATPDLDVANISEAETKRLAHLWSNAVPGSRIECQGAICTSMTDVRFPDQGAAFGYDLYFAYKLGGSIRGRSLVNVEAADSISHRIDGYCLEHHIPDRLGIRIRVYDGRASTFPTRRDGNLQRYLEPVLASDPAIPIFLMTDAASVEASIRSHFLDVTSFPKQFPSDGYLDRADGTAAATFVAECFCLLRCRRIIRIGNLLNLGHHSRAKELAPPISLDLWQSFKT